LACGLAPGASAAVPPAVHHGPQFGIAAVGKWPKGYFVVDSRPGTRFYATLLVTNRGDAAGTVRLSGVDATTGRTSGAVYLDPAARQHGVGSWISLARRELTLAPGASARVPFSVAVPSSAGVGEHLGGLIVEPTRLATPEGHAGTHGALGIRVRQLSIV